MVAELDPQWGKFGQPSEQVRLGQYYTVKLLKLELKRAKNM